MTPIYGTQALLDNVESVKLPPVTQLEKAAMADSAPWLYSALSQLRTLEDEGRLQPGIGDFRTSPASARAARLMLATVAITDLPGPVVSPVSGGGLSITWVVGEREVKFAFYPDGQAMLFTCVDDDVVTPGEVVLGNTISVNEPLKWMVQPRK